jgi:hypothetical protein
LNFFGGSLFAKAKSEEPKLLDIKEMRLINAIRALLKGTNIVKRG